MRNNKMKGFTLVELLVVIAILAILATVSVVGYTSYIEGATVRVDEDLAAQLTRFLEAYKVNNPGEITEDNIWQITQDVLEESGINDLEPKAAQYGYHFYFKFDGQGGGQYVARNEEGLTPSALMRLFGYYAYAADPSTLRPGVFVEGTEKYFIVDTIGSPLAEAVKGFYSLEDYEEEGDTLETRFNKWLECFETLESEYAYLETYAKTSVFVTKDGIVYDKTATSYTNYVFHADDGLQMSETPKVTLTNPVKVPNNVEYFGIGAFNVENNTGVDAPIVLDRNGAELAGYLSENFTNVNFELADGLVWQLLPLGNIYTDLSVINPVTDATVEYPVGATNPLKDFDIALNGSTNRFYNLTSSDKKNELYAVWHEGSFTLDLVAASLVAKDETKPLSSKAVIYSLTNASGAPATYTGVTLDGNTITLTKGASTLYPNVNEIYVTATVSHDRTKSITFKINLAKLTEADVMIDDVKPNNGQLSLLWGEMASGDKNSYEISVDETSYGYNANHKAAFNFDYDLDEVTVTVDEAEYTKNGLTITTVDGFFGNATSKTTTVKVNIGGHVEYTITLTLDYVDFLYEILSSGIKVLGTDGLTVSIDDLFVLTGTVPAGSTVKVNAYLPATADQNLATLKMSDFNVLPNVNTEDKEGYGVWANSQSIATNEAFDFALTDAADPQQIIIVVTLTDGADNTVRASDNLVVDIVGANNIKTFADLLANSDKSKVLLSDVEMPENANTEVTISNATLYGNGYTVDLRGYDDIGTTLYNEDGTVKTYAFETGVVRNMVSGIDRAIITLDNATINNVKIVGEVYKSSDFNYMTPTNFSYGASLVMANGNSYIIDSYLANTRSPLIVNGAVTIDNSTIFGGHYANVDVLNGSTLTLKNNVTTINQITTATPETVGIGIAVDLFANPDTTSIVLDSTCNLVQYNYVSKADTKYLPIVSYNKEILGISMGVNVYLSSEISALFPKANGPATGYEQFLFTDSTDTQYVNTGIVFINGLKLMQTVGRYTLTGGWKETTTDETTSMTGAYTGNGQQINLDPNKYHMASLSDERHGTVDVKLLTYTIDLYEHIYVWMEKPNAETNNGAKFNNDASDYLPTQYYVNLGE